MTAREKVLLQRAAFITGARTAGASGAASAALAREYFPMPTETRDRTVEVHGLTYRCKDGVLEFQSPTGEWDRSGNTVAEFGSDISKIADLILHPTETVEVTE